MMRMSDKCYDAIWDALLEETKDEQPTGRLMNIIEEQFELETEERARRIEEYEADQRKGR